MSFTFENDYAERISAIDQSIDDKNIYLKKIKKILIDTESSIIELKIKKDKLLEELRIKKITTVSDSLSDRDKDIERFKKILPDILNKV